eukprot:TRINITY_DN7461_c0_g1_i3.p1 TRINITY_DN7461_c0_g1~~TRINITY_DN7461_c0_g1_i3.p1  ORF type:complete len:313 (-),score=49.50 TRINITY_DN7461_c0_g1_i3:249-1187(-)
MTHLRLLLDIIKGEGQTVVHLEKAISTQMEKISEREIRPKNSNETIRSSKKMTSLNLNISSVCEFLALVSSYVSPTILTQHLTMLSFEIWKELQPSELMNATWTKPQTQHLSPHVCRLIKRFNHVSSWVASSILYQERLTDRIKYLQYFIECLYVCEKINNYNDMLAILSGINNSAVRRLSHSFAGLSRKYKSCYTKLDNLMHPDSSYRAYRSCLRKCLPPALPYLGVYLTDIIFIEEGNPDRKKGLINFSKRRLLYKVIEEIQQKQAVCYNFSTQSQILTYLEELPHEGDDQLYRLSLQREPRGCEKKSLI